MSPEQARGETLDARSDLFSVGGLLYEMVTGQRPFQGTSAAAIAAAILTQDPPPLARFAPQTPAELDRIVTKLLKKDPGHRYQTARDLLIDLQTLKEEQEFQAKLGRTPMPASTTSAGSAVATAPAATDRSAPSCGRQPSGRASIPARGWHGRRRTDRARRRRVVRLARDERAMGQRPHPGAVGTGRSQALRRGVRPRRGARAVRAERSDDLARDVDDRRHDLGDDRSAGSVGVSETIPRRGRAVAAASARGRVADPNVRIARGEYVLSIAKEGYAPIERTVSGVAVRAGALTITPPPMRITNDCSPQPPCPNGWCSCQAVTTG